MNNNGSTFLVSFMLAIILFLLGLAIAPALKDTTQESMNDPIINCSTTTNNQLKAVCTSIDMQQLFIGFIFGVAGLIIARSL